MMVPRSERKERSRAEDGNCVGVEGLKRDMLLLLLIQAEHNSLYLSPLSFAILRSGCVCFWIHQNKI